MAHDFHYVPLPPEPISGPEVLKQTEEAINELGTHIDTEVSGIRDIANQALTTSQQAITTANAASQTANSAVSIANEASAKADSFQEQIDQAVSTANSAVSTATAADDKAQAALDLSGQANANSQAAQDAVQGVVETADNALTTSQEAKDIAENAYSLALAESSFAVDADAGHDANLYFDDPVRLYLTGANFTNFPVGVEAPFYFDVTYTQPLVSATQRVWTQDGLQEWRRVASVTEGSEEEPSTATWGQWVPIGGIPEENPGWLPLFFVLPSEEPSRSMIPPGYTAASVQSYETDGESTTVTLEASPAVGGGEAIVIPAYPETVDVSALASKGVNFTLTYEGDEPTEAFVLVRLST